MAKTPSRTIPVDQVLPDTFWLISASRALPELRIVRTSGSVLSVLPENFKNTWRYSAGFNYQYDEHVVLRAGVAYDQWLQQRDDAALDEFASALGTLIASVSLTFRAR